MSAQREYGLLLSLSGRLYGLPLGAVVEVLKPRPLTRVPGGPQHIDGVARVSAGIVPVLALGRRLGLGDESLAKAARLVVAEAGETRIGLLVDQIAGLWPIGAGRIKPPSPECPGAQSGLVRGVQWNGGRPVGILAVDRLLVATATV